MRTTDPEFWNELTQNHSNTRDFPERNEQLAEDVGPKTDKFDTALEDEDADDSDTPISTLINMMIARDTNLPATLSIRHNGTLTSLADVENLDSAAETIEPASEGSGEGSSGHGKRKKLPNQHYTGFWRHYDEDNEWVGE